MRVSPRQGEPKRKVLITDLDEAINQLNALFFAVSVEKNSDIDIPPLVFMMFARLFGFSGDRFFGFGGFATYITMYDYFRNEQRSTIFHPKKELLLLCTPAYLSHKDEIAQKISPHVLTPALAFVTSLRKTMQVLAVDPVLISTGQHQPIFDKPRSYADVQAEIASTLANLPRFTAKIKLAGDNAKPEEHIIRTISPNELHVPRLSLAAFAQRIERIKQHNIQQGYLRLRVDIEKEITERQKTLLDSDKGKQTKQDDED